jgi:hypothetical protein
VLMNAIAAAPGWRSAAIWVMPPIAYALASDTLISAIRTRAVSYQRRVGAALADDEVTPLAAAGGLMLWLLRLILAPASTLTGFRAWVLRECPVAPGRGAASMSALPMASITPTAPVIPARPAPAIPDPGETARGPRAGTKTASFLALAIERHGPPAAIPLTAVSKICAELAPAAGLDTGAARTALRRTVLAAQNRSTP